MARAISPRRSRKRRANSAPLLWLGAAGLLVLLIVQAFAGYATADSLVDPRVGSQAWLQHADLGAEATTAAWAPDGMQIALATKEGIRLYDATEAHPSPLWEGAGHADAVTAVAFSPCGTKLATGGADRIAKVWDLTDPANPAEVAVFKGHSGAVRAVSWSPDGATIATGSDDKSVRVWSLATGRELMALRGHGSNIEAVAFSPDGNKLASASWDWSVRVWDVKKRVSMLHIRNHSDWVRGVSWHPDGELLATASDDGTALIYDVAKNAQVAKLKHPNDVNSVSWSPVGGLLVTASDDGKLRIFDSEGQAVRSLTAYPSAIRSVAWHPDGSQLLTTGASENAKVWIDESLVVESDPEPEPGPEPGKPVKTDVKEDWGLAGAITLEEFSVTVARYSPDGSLIVAASESGPIVGIDSESLEEVFRVDSHGLSLYPLSLAWAPEGDRFVVGDSNGVVAVFDSAGELLQRAEVGLSGVRSIAVSHDGAEIAVGLNEGTVIILSEDLEEFGSMDGHSDWVRGIAWSPDDLFLVTGSDDRTVNIWDTESLGLGASMTGHSDWVRSVAWSPAGDLVASSSDDGYVRLWNSSTATERKLSGHGDWVRAVTFSPDGRYVASAGDDRRVFVWSVDSDEAIAEMYVNGDWLYSIDWSPQGDTILVSDGGGTVSVFHVAEEMVHDIALNLPPEIADVEWPQYVEVRDMEWPQCVEVRDMEWLLCVEPELEPEPVDPSGSGSEWHRQRTAKVHPEGIMSIAMAPYSINAVTGGKDSTVRIVDTVRGLEVTKLEGHSDWVRSVAWSPDFMHIASASDDGTVKIWDYITDEEIHSFNHPDWMRVVEFDPYGIYLAAGGDEGVVYVYDMEGNETKLEAPPNGGAVYDIDWVQTYRENLILVGMVSGSVTIYDGFTYELIDSIDACDWVLSVEADADGKKFAGGCANGTVFVFTDGEVQKSTVHSDWVRSVSWSPEGNRFASASDDGKVIVWTVDENGAPHVDQVLRAGDVYVYSVAWSRDGTQLIATDDNGSLIYWSTGAVKEFEVDLQFARSLGDDYRRVMGVTTNYDGRRVVVGDTGGVVKLYEVDSGKVVTLGQHSDWVRAVAYDPLSMSVASVGDDGKLMVWDPRSGGLKKECEGAHNDWIRALAFSEEKKQLATAGDDMVVKIWRMPGYSCATTHEIQVPGGDYPIAVALSPDSSTVAVATIGGALYVMESASGEVVAEVQLANGYMDATGLAFSRDGLFLAAGGESLVVLDGETFEEITRVPAMGEIRDLAWNKDGNEISVVDASGLDSLVLFKFQEGELSVMGKAEDVGEDMTLAVGSTYFVAVGGDDGVLDLYTYNMDIFNILFPESDFRRSSETWEMLAEFAGDDADWTMLDVAFSPDSTLLAFAHSQGIEVVDIETQVVIQSLRGHTDWVRSIAFHPYDSAILASAGDDRTVRIWNAITGEQMGVLEGHDDWVRDITWHPEGEMLASSGDDRTVRIWMDVLSDDPEKPVAILDDANDWVRSLAFSPDGEWLATGSDDNKVRVYSVNDGESNAPVYVLSSDVLTGYITALMWATEGAVLVAGDTGGKLVVYDVEMEFEEMDMPIDAFASINDIAIALSYPDDDDYYGELDYVLVGTDSGLAIYDSNGDFMQLMLAHGGSGTRAVKMSPDGDLMATAEKEFRSLSAGNDGYVRVWVVPPSEDDSSSYYEYYDDDSTVANDPDIDVDGLQAMMKELDMDVDDDMPDLDALLKELDDLLKELDEIEV